MDKSVSGGPLCCLDAEVTHTHTLRLYAVKPVVYLHHIQVLACSFALGDKKPSLLCVDNYSSLPYLAPVGLLRGAGNQIYTHTHTQAEAFFS